MPHNKVAFDWLEQNIGILAPRDSMLYVGWRSGSSMWWLDVYAKMLGAKNVGLIEAHVGNFMQFKKDIPKWNVRVEDCLPLFRPDEWDLLFWDHGIEHASDEQSLIANTEKFKEHFRSILYVCPWGKCPNDTGGNPFEKHNFSVYESTFKSMSFDVMTFNSPDTGCAGELVGWWKRGE